VGEPLKRNVRRLRFSTATSRNPQRVRIVARRKWTNFDVACLSFWIGLSFSSGLLCFLFGTSIYSRYSYRGLMAPSFYFLSIGYVTMFDRVLSYIIDAAIFGAILYLLIAFFRRCFSGVMESLTSSFGI
jgi:hypothetical protein